MYYDLLKNLTLYAIGDSYIAGDSINKNEVWPFILAEKYCMTFENYAICGSTISVTPNGGYDPMVRRFDKMNSKSPDIVIFQGGRNDFNNDAEIGDNVDFKETTFKGAINIIIDGLRKKYPGAFIVTTTPYFVTGLNNIGRPVFDYIDAFKEVSEYNHVPCIDASNRSLTGVIMDDPEFRKKYCVAPDDVSHLNAKGQAFVMPKFEKEIARLYEEFIK